MITNQPPPPPPSALIRLSGLPLACVLDRWITPEYVFQRFSRLPYCLFLDSALKHESLGRYSFLAADPFDVVTIPVGAGDPLATLRQKLAEFFTPVRSDLPPFQGGAAGVFAYELGHSFEQLPAAPHDELSIPAITVGLYDVVIAFDHRTKNAWIISSGFPETSSQRRQARAHQRLKLFHQLLNNKKQREYPEYEQPEPAPCLTV